MRLFIAEKPSLGREIAANLPGTQEAKKGYIKIGHDNIVTWLFGHIMKMEEPEDINSKYKKWVLEDLPIIPAIWKLVIANEEQYKIIQGLINQYNPDQIINAGDPDREGQLLVDEVLESMTLGNSQVMRLWIQDLSSKGFQRAFESIKSNNEPLYKGMKKSAETRQRIDWLVGMNLSRYFSIMAQKKGLSGVFPVGRVKTPTLALVVRREREIKNFKPVQYFPIIGFFKTLKDETFQAKWVPNQDQLGLDCENRLIDVIKAREITNKVKENKLAVVSGYSVTKKEEKQPGMFSLSKLQLIAGKQYGYDPKDVLEICQSLYEKKITTYPRTDCEYMPENQFEDAAIILDKLKATGCKDIMLWASATDSKIKSPSWNDKKVTAHNAIVPTQEGCNFEDLSKKEQDIYYLIAQNYIAQFLPTFKYLHTKIEINCAEETFVTSGRTIEKLEDKGWKVIYSEDKEKGDEDSEDKTLPILQEGMNIDLIRATIQEKETKPPKRFTTATLVDAMKKITGYVKNPDLKKILRETEGIGTEATRATIIDELLTKNFIQKDKKNIIPTSNAYTLIDALPDEITWPDLTASMEIKLADLQNNKASAENILQDQINEIDKIVAQKDINIDIKNQIICPECKKGIIRKMKGKNGLFWACSCYPECKTSYQDDKGKPNMKPKEKIACPACKTGHLFLRKGKEKGKDFWGCDQWQNGCKATFSDHKGKPQIINCPKCKKGFLKKIKGAKGDFWACSCYPECKTSYQDKKGNPYIK